MLGTRVFPCNVNHCNSQKKEEVPLDETYAILKRVAAGEFVFIDYKNGVGPQIEIKYKRGEKKFIHRAAHTWTKFSGK